MKIIRKRITTIMILFIIGFIVILLRLGYIQFFKGDVFIERAYDLWTRNIPVAAKRGNIYDRNGKPLATNKLANSVTYEDQETYNSDRERHLNLNSKIHYHQQL